MIGRKLFVNNSAWNRDIKKNTYLAFYPEHKHEDTELPVIVRTEEEDKEWAEKIWIAAREEHVSNCEGGHYGYDTFIAWYEEQIKK